MAHAETAAKGPLRVCSHRRKYLQGDVRRNVGNGYPFIDDPTAATRPSDVAKVRKLCHAAFEALGVARPKPGAYIGERPTERVSCTGRDHLSPSTGQERTQDSLACMHRQEAVCLESLSHGAYPGVDLVLQGPHAPRAFMR